MAPSVGEQRLDPQFGPDRRDRPSPDSVGTLLRRTREGYGQDLGVVAMQLRIRIGYLRAIEEGRSRDLPGSTYAVGFVRTYAEYLGLDTQEVLRRFREEVADVNGQTQLIFPAAAAEGKFPGGAILLLSLMVAAVAYGGWYYLSDRQTSVLEMIAPVPERLAALVSGGETADGQSRDADAPPASEPAAEAAPGITPPSDAEAAADVVPAPASEEPEAAGAAPVESEEAASAGPAASDGSAGTAVATEGVDSAVDEAAASADESGAAPEQTAAAAPQVGAATAEPVVEARSEGAAEAIPEAEPAPSPLVAPEGGAGDAGASLAAIPAAPVVPPAEDVGQVFGAANAESRVVLRARLESWVQVTDADNNTLLTRVLRAGDSYRVPDQPGLMLTTGNAGGLDILVDGRMIPSLGPVGVVRRDIALDPGRLVAGTALPQ